MGLDEFLARVHGITHQHVEGAVSFSGIIHIDLKQGAVGGVHGRFPQLIGVNLTETFVALQTRLLANLFHCFVFFLVAIYISDLILISNAVQRRLGNI